jgi:hypothetical protein
MDTLLLRVHQKQIEHQCRAGIMALDLAQKALSSRDQEEFWASIQNALSAAANIAKSLWGQGGKLAQEREPLRQSLGISDSSPLSSTDLRNHLEHYDERLDRWYRTSQRRNHADYLIGPASMIAGTEATDIFRHFDPSTGDVIFWIENYSIPPLGRALAELLPTATREAVKPHWD